MKVRCHTVLTALSLALLGLSTAGAARANSVTGSAALPVGVSVRLTVTATTAPMRGSVSLVAGGDSISGAVVGVDAGGHEAFVLAEITQTSFPELLGLFTYLHILDNGPTGDEVTIQLTDLNDYETIYQGPVTNGNFVVTGEALSCFTAGTRVTMADGSEKPIEQIEVGEQVLGPNGEVNRVLRIERPLLGERKLYSLNGGVPFVTAEHPFMTKEGWKAIDPNATAAENPSLTVGTLKPGDALVRLEGTEAPAVTAGGSPTKPRTARLSSMALERFEARSADPKTQLYNLRLDGSHVYFANGYLVHNK